MHFSSVLAASLVAPLVAAHGGVPGAPKVYGLPNHLRARNPFAANKAPRNAMPMPHKPLIGRQNGDAGGVCGPDNGGRKCLSTECCSPEGNCGNGADYCPAPDCLFEYGPACDANQTPAGASTRNDARPKMGTVAIGGAGIYACKESGEVALTFDDGPYIYTNHILDLLAAAGAKATFFITGNNLGKGAIDTNWASVISRMDTDGHQVASHTWSHQDLSNITESEVYDQMVKNEMALRNILGKYPTYMRPPYSDCNGICQGVMSALGYHVIYFDVDTDDYDNDAPNLIQNAKNNFKNGIDSRGAGNDRLVIAHDIHEQTANNLTQYMLDYLKTQGLTPVTVGQCLGDSATNWYRKSTPAVSSSSSSSTRPTSTPSSASSSGPVASPTGPTSTDGTCGGTNKYSCLGFKQENGDSGECCSQYGFCGSSALYCGTGCQAGFGKCGVVSASSTSSAPVATATAPSTDGSCGGVKGFTCAGYMKNGALNECCSDFGYCGNTTTYCGTGCQAGYGKCLGGSSSMSSMSSTVSVSSFSSMSSKAASSTSSAASSVTSGSTRASSSTASRSSSASSSSVGSSSSSKSTSMTRSSSSSSVKSTASGSSSTRSSSASSVKSTASGSSSTRASASGSSSTRASISGSSSTRASVSGASSTPVSASSGSASVKSTTAASSSVASVKATSATSSGAVSVKATSAASSYPTSSMKPSSATPYSTAVKPSSVIAYAASSPSASAVVSKNGKCGTKYGAGQTCAGYVNAMGVAVECCCADSGTCSNDSWACGQGCDKGFGKCWGY